jgi:hypothetical protein
MSLAKIQNTLALDFEGIAYGCETIIQGAVANMPEREKGEGE